jgi:hypothetical protein
MRAVERSLRHLIARFVGLLVLAVAAVAPATAAAAGDPAGNRSLSNATEQSCSENPTGDACINSALADINAAHAAEGVQPMVLPSNFASMSVPVQLLNLSDLERIDRGLAPILGLSAALNQDAQSAAAQDQDPMPTHFYGTVATGNWAAGYDSTLEADFGWMYDDGLGSDNLDCTSANQSGCWGHRHDILWHFDTPIAMGAGSATGQYGPSMTELFVGGDTRTGAGQPDAPVVRPSQTSVGGSSSGNGTGAGNPTPAPVTGHAAGRQKPKPHAWIGAMTHGPRGLHVTVGCTGPIGRVCKVTIALTVAGRTAAIKTVRIAAGHQRAIGLALDRAARRHLRKTHKLRTHLAVHQGAKTLFSRTVTFRRS